MSRYSTDTITQRHVELAQGFTLIRATLDAIANDTSMPELYRLQRQHDLVSQHEVEAVSSYALQNAAREHEMSSKEMALRLEELKQNFVQIRRNNPILHHFGLVHSVEMAKAEVAATQRQHDDLIERGIRVEPRHTYAAQQSVRNTLWVMESYMSQLKARAGTKVPACLSATSTMNKPSARTRRPSLS